MSASEPPTEPRSPLNRETIIGAAIVLADRDSIGKLSMRSLASHLHYKPMSLYTHVANKSELLALMADHVAAGIAEPDPKLIPLDAVRTFAVATRSVLAKHTWASALWLQHLPGPRRTRHMEVSLQLMYDCGFPDELAHCGFHAVTDHVLGYTLQDLGLTMHMDDPQAVIADYLDRTDEAEFPRVVQHVHEHMRGESGGGFEFALDLILEGLERRNTK